MRASIAVSLAALLTVFLFFPPPPVSAETRLVINKGTNQLAYFLDDYLIEVFPVATGRQPQYTPEGQWRVVVKMVYPSWRNPRGGPVIPGGVPANPLGPRWLGLNALGTGGSSYGIHGNNSPSSIGTYASSGCIRMRNEDILWLYERVPLGTGVKIVNLKENLMNWKKFSRVTVNGQLVEFAPHQGPVQSGDATYLPVRPVAAAMGYRLKWDAPSGNLLLANIDREVLLTPGSSRLIVNNAAMEGDEAPFLLQNNTYLPVMYFPRFLGASLNLDEESKTIALEIPDDPSLGRLSRYYLTMRVNGRDAPIPDHQTPLTDGQRVLVPIGPVCEAAGAVSYYNHDNTALEIRLTGRRVTIPLAGGPALVNGSAAKNSAHLFTRNGASFVYLDFLAEALNLKVEVNDLDRTLHISTYNLTSMFSNPFRLLGQDDLRVILAARGYPARL